MSRRTPQLKRGAGLARTIEEVAHSRARIARIGQVSDGLVRLGPFRIGLDGLLTWAPGLGEVYSLAAGGLLLFEGVRAHAPPTALAKVAGLVLGRALLSTAGETPVLGVLAKLTVDGFRAHKLSADILTRAIDETDYVQLGAPEIVAGTGRRRVVLKPAGRRA